MAEWLSRNNVGRISQYAKLSSENYRVKQLWGPSLTLFQCVMCMFIL